MRGSDGPEEPNPPPIFIDEYGMLYQVGSPDQPAIQLSEPLDPNSWTPTLGCIEEILGPVPKPKPKPETCYKCSQKKLDNWYTSKRTGKVLCPGCFNKRQGRQTAKEVEG